MAGYFAGGSTALRIPIRITQGEKFELPITLTSDGTSTGTPLDITNWLFESQIRHSANSALSATINVSKFAPTLGEAVLVLMPDETQAIPAGDSVNSLDSHYEYDCFGTPPGGIRKKLIARSPVTIEPAITH